MSTNLPARETKRADELKPGDWLLFDEDGDYEPNEVKAAFEYPTASGPRIHLTTQIPGKHPYSSGALAPNSLHELATDAEIVSLREKAERAQRIVDIRALADMLERDPQLPMPNLTGLTVWVEFAELREIAARIGVELRSGSKMSDVEIEVGGSVVFQLVAWHPDGRPAEPKPGTTCEELSGELDDPTGQLYSRPADDPTPVSGARVEPHVGGMTEQGLVDETPAEPVGTDACGCPVYPYAGRGDSADTIVRHLDSCDSGPGL